MTEMKKIEVRKKERDRKTQDLQKLISQADQQSESNPNNLAGSSSGRKQDRKIIKKRVQPPSRPNRADPTVSKNVDKLFSLIEHALHKINNFVYCSYYCIGARISRDKVS